MDLETGNGVHLRADAVRNDDIRSVLEVRTMCLPVESESNYKRLKDRGISVD